MRCTAIMGLAVFLFLGCDKDSTAEKSGDKSGDKSEKGEVVRVPNDLLGQYKNRCFIA